MICAFCVAIFWRKIRIAQRIECACGLRNFSKSVDVDAVSLLFGGNGETVPLHSTYSSRLFDTSSFHLDRFSIPLNYLRFSFISYAPFESVPSFSFVLSANYYIAHQLTVSSNPIIK